MLIRSRSYHDNGTVFVHLYGIEKNLRSDFKFIR
jgi:hypothetical protein